MSPSMMNVIKSRRSIRMYSSRKVTKKVVLKFLDMATWAPSAHNAQPWRLIVIMEEDLKKEFSTAMARDWTKDMAGDGVPPETRKSLVKTSIERFTQAPVIVVACLTMADMDEYPDIRRQECEKVMAVQSLAAAIQNILLAASSEGLGACWFCTPLFCQDTVREVLRIPREVEPQAIVTLGYPSEIPDAPHRRRIEEVAYENYWGEAL